MRRCLFLWGSTVKCSITDKSPFLAQSFKFAHLPTKKGNDRYVCASNGEANLQKVPQGRKEDWLYLSKGCKSLKT